MLKMKGQLITLEPLNIEKHAKGYFDVCQDERIHLYTGNHVPSKLHEVVKLLEKYEQLFINWIITANDTGSVIGLLRLSRPQRVDGVLVAGESQFLHSAYWRKGHMKEAKALLYPYVFQKLAVDALYADVWEGNTNSRRSLESYGYVQVETKTERFSKTGKETKKYIYALTKEDYLRRQTKHTDYAASVTQAE